MTPELLSELVDWLSKVSRYDKEGNLYLTFNFRAFTSIFGKELIPSAPMLEMHLHM